MNVASPNHRTNIVFKLSGRSASRGAPYIEISLVGIMVLAGLVLRRRKTYDPTAMKDG